MKCMPVLAASVFALTATIAGATTYKADYLDIPTTTLDRGSETGIVEAGYHSFLSEGEFVPFWEQHTSGRDFRTLVPTIDWDTEMVLAVYLGQNKGSFSHIEMTQVDVLSGVVVAHVERVDVPSALPVLLNPFHIIVTERWDAPVVFPDYDAMHTTIESGWSQDVVLPDHNVIIEDETTWNQIWGMVHHLEESAPEVNFKEFNVLALSSGQLPSPSYGIRAEFVEVANFFGQDRMLIAVENVVPSKPSIMIPGFAWRFIMIERMGSDAHIYEFTQIPVEE